MSDLDDLNSAFSKTHGTKPLPTVGTEAQKRDRNPVMEFIKNFAAPTSGPSTFQDRVMQAVTFGGMDNLISAVTAGAKAPFSDKSFGDIYNEEQTAYQKTRQEQDTAHPYIGGAGTVVGALAGPDPTAKLKLAGKAGQIGKSILSGAVNTGLQAFGEADTENLVGRLKSAADGFMLGGAIGGGAGALGSAISRHVDVTEGRKLQRSLADMRKATKEGYDVALSTGEMIPGELISKNLQDVARKIRGTAGFRMENPDYRGLNDLMEDLQAKVVDQNGSVLALDLASLDDLQKQAWMTYHNAKKGTQPLVLQVIKALDKSMDEAAEVGTPLLKAARMSSRMERNTQMFDEIMKTAERKAESGVGDYATRFKYAAEKILDNKKYNQFLNDEERAALQSIVDGTVPGNAARFIGRFAPNSGNMASLIGILTAYHNPIVGIPAMAGAYASKGASNVSTRNLVDEARRVFSGSPAAAPAQQLGPTIAKAAGQSAAGQLPSLLDMTGLTQPGQAANPTLMELNTLYKMQQQQQGQ